MMLAAYLLLAQALSSDSHFFSMPEARLSAADCAQVGERSVLRAQNKATGLFQRLITWASLQVPVPWPLRTSFSFGHWLKL